MARYTYIVRGRWPFPIDMIRRDGSYLAENVDMDRYDRLTRDNRPEDNSEVEIALIGPDIPLVDRWNSFKWVVMSITDRKTHKDIPVHPPLDDQLPKKAAGTIDITPSWQHLMEIVLLALEEGTEDGKASAKAQLRDLAKDLDRLNFGKS